MNANIQHFDLRLVDPPFGSKLNTMILELDNLRKKIIVSETPRHVFLQLKKIFHLLESIGTARIEGNRTTLVEYIEQKIEGVRRTEEAFLEISNNEEAIEFIESNIAHHKIDRALISEVHKIITRDLSPPPRGEGSRNPGEYRKVPVAVRGSAHVPPDMSTVAAYMDELFDFINRPDPPQYDLLKTAICHHRFVWIHPFDNGNGRVVRLLTYAMLIKYGFRVHMAERIINPTAVFCSDREKYYSYLSIADEGSDGSLLRWCEYVLGGLSEEISKVDKLLDYSFLRDRILLPSVSFALESRYIREVEFRILETAIKRKIIQARDVKKVLPGKSPQEISRIIRKLKEKKMLRAESDKSRKYGIQFENNQLLRGIIEILGRERFLPVPINR